ncbi:hypothetical protein FJK98_06420 [Micromonospora sp. HM134]|uniref:tetratricopeptide repeat protein n=1 Tax=Micromonospora sp. HM134 TaxID=2583243 RepID=UPI001198A957|nr:hypothetical protein [Micromonospora sp. HM134]QDY06848.1 hypothetical protein FJK98_06420 [Micromonospora sp. HM134]
MSGSHLDANLAVGLDKSVVDALEQWQVDTGNAIHYERWLTGGNTAAPVAVVVITGAGGPAKVILKACPPERSTSREPRLHSQALAESPPDFAERHLVQRPFETVESNTKWRVLFQAVAGDSLRQVAPLSSIIRDSRLADMARQITSRLLTGWNPAPGVRKMTPYEVLRSDLGTRADKKGPLTRFNHAHKLEAAPWIRFPTRLATVVPNALFWIEDSTLWPDDAAFFGLLGRAHGDLHPGNVLLTVSPSPSPDGFRLIDLSSYEPSASLAKDLMYLALAVVAEYLDDTPARREELLDVLLTDADGVSSGLQSPRDVVRSIRHAAKKWQVGAAPGMDDDWDDQVQLALVGAALQGVGRVKATEALRLWYFELACRALGQYLRRQEAVEFPPDPGTVPVCGPQLDEEVRKGIDRLFGTSGVFNDMRSVVALLSPGVSSTRLGELPWTAVMSFDPDIDTTGPLASARQQGNRLHRLVTNGQNPEFRHGSTTWIVFGDDAEAVGARGGMNHRSWRRHNLPLIEESVSVLARFSSRPIALVVLGDPDKRVGAIVQAFDDRFGGRSTMVLVSATPSGIDDYVDEHIAIEPGKLLDNLPALEDRDTVPSTIPGLDGPVLLAAEDAQWFREFADLLDSPSGTMAGSTENTGRGFLQGRPVTWFELSLGLDVRPGIADDLEQAVRVDLAGRDTRRIALMHFPGAGGTTLGRRLAWDLHSEFPTIYCTGTHDDYGLAERVSRLSQLSGLSVLVVLENTTDAVTEGVYNRLRGDSVPAVVVVVGRRFEKPREAGPRSFYLGPAATRAELSSLVSRYVEYAPQRADSLRAIQPGLNTAVPFYLGLVAFEKEFHGLAEHVRRSLARISDTDRTVFVLIAVAHRYAGVSVASDLFAEILQAKDDQAVILEKHLSDAVQNLLAEEAPGYWRTVHWLIAEESLRQLLTPSGAAAEAWRLSLSSIASNIIAQASTVFGEEPPDDIRDLLDRLFINRENRELLSGERQRSFSEFLEGIPSNEGRLEVMRQLAEHFPGEAHYWAHYGRLLSYAGDSDGALQAAKRALDINDADTVLFHIRGMIYTRRLRGLAQAKESDEGEILRLTELALSDFDAAAKLDDKSEYPHVATVSVAVTTIDVARHSAGRASFSEFLALPGSSVYRELVERAERAMDSVQEIRGADPMSARAQAASVQLLQLYDDYTALLQGWRNLLDRPDVLKSPIRRRLARVYVRRAGDWKKLSRDDWRRVLALLEDNLRDDPSDEASLRDWLRAARSGAATLDRASELVSNWAMQRGSREAYLYDYIIEVLQVINGRRSQSREAQRKIDRCRDFSLSFGNRKFSYEWLGKGDGLSQLVHYSEVPSTWNRDRGDEIPATLRVMPAKVSAIRSPQAGTLVLEHTDLKAFFVPARAGVLRGRHENARVDAALGFSYDGIRAWSVTLRS